MTTHGAVARDHLALAEAAARRILGADHSQHRHRPPVEEPDNWADLFPEVDDAGAEAAARDMVFGRWPE